MGISVILFLAVFWTGVVLVILSWAGFISIPVWAIVVVCLFLLSLIAYFAIRAVNKSEDNYPIKDGLDSEDFSYISLYAEQSEYEQFSEKMKREEKDVQQETP